MSVLGHLQVNEHESLDSWIVHTIRFFPYLKVLAYIATSSWFSSSRTGKLSTTNRVQQNGTFQFSAQFAYIVTKCHVNWILMSLLALALLMSATFIFPITLSQFCAICRQLTNRPKTFVLDFMRKYDFNDPEYGNFYQAQWDEYSDFLRTQLTEWRFPSKIFTYRFDRKSKDSAMD